MADTYRIFGAELSPYSVKTRSYYRYKGIPHEWIVRSGNTMAEYQKYARLPIIPAVATPEDEGLQDSTPILEAMEAKFPEPSTHPPGAALKFLSELLEEFGDEWGNKWMFHYRWADEADQRSAATRLVDAMMPDAPEADRAAMAGQIQERMVGRVGVVGSNEHTAPIIEASFTNGAELLEKHLVGRPYLFGGRPSFADFGLWGQVYNAWTDPTCGKILNQKPAVRAWIDRMLDPKAEGDFESWDTLAPTLEPILQQEVRIFLVWASAIAEAIGSGADDMTVDLDGKKWSQTVGGPQKYHAKSLKEMRRKYAEVNGDDELRAILERSGCLGSLA
ncbi:MAG: glutathione S-transferase family protein [Candidatus Binatia bacterium]|nr:glutathione S-transferase family protein [Candidatus Binatia bacterium]